MIRVVIFSFLLTLACTRVWAVEWFIFPDKDQSAEQQESDEAHCRSLARQEAGIDSTQDTAPAGDGRAAGRASAGAEGEAAAGEKPGRSGDGAAAHLAGHRDHLQSAAVAREAEVKRQAEFDHAFAVCMRRQGYTVRH